jgi:hypothetical protein
MANAWGSARGPRAERRAPTCCGQEPPSARAPAKRFEHTFDGLGLDVGLALVVLAVVLELERVSRACRLATYRPAWAPLAVDRVAASPPPRSGGAAKSENAVIARLVSVCIPGHTPLWAADACHWPPRSSPASKTVTSKPASSACLAATRPLGPAPTIATRAPGGSLTRRRYPIRRRSVRGSEPAS